MMDDDDDDDEELNIKWAGNGMEWNPCNMYECMTTV